MTSTADRDADRAVQLGAARLTVNDVVDVARDGRAVASLGPQATQAVEATAAWVAQTIDQIAEARAAGATPPAYYGINTGFGAMAGRSALSSRYLAQALGRNLVASHAVGAGPMFDEEVVRATLLIRAQSLAQGYSGVRPLVVDTLVRMLNAGVYPAVPEQGSLGASGDLAPLAHILLVMSAPPTPGSDDVDLGQDPTDGEAFVRQPTDQPAGAAHLHLTEAYRGGQTLWRRVPGAEAMAAIGGKIDLHAKEALALLNGATVSAAVGALVVRDARNLLRNAELAVAMSLEGVRGFRDPFFPNVHRARGHAAALETAGAVLAHVEGSELLDPGDLATNPRRVPPQDPYCLRCAPQVLGSVADTLDLASRWVEMDINAATDNPLIFLDLERDYKTLSGGNFHGEPIAMAMDFLGIAATEIANTSDRRMFTLCDYHPETAAAGQDPRRDLGHGLSSFLIDEPAGTAGLNSGLMMLQATAAALVSDCKALAHPDSVDSIPSSGNQEDHVSMSLNAARHARQIVRNAEQVIALEFLCAAQAIALQLAKPGMAGARLGAGTGAAYAAIRAAGIAPLVQDRVLQADIHAALRMVRSGTLVAAAQRPR